MHKNASHMDSEALDPDVEFLDFLMKTKEIFSSLSLCDKEDVILEVETEVQSSNSSDCYNQEVFNEINCDKKEVLEEDADMEFMKFIAKMKEGFPAEINKENPSSLILKCSSPSTKQRSYSCFNDSSTLDSKDISIRDRSRSMDGDLSFNMFGEETDTIQIFTKNRDVYTMKLYKFFNERVFNNRLPADMEVKWSANLTKTAGLTHARRTGAFYSCSIDLSTKVLTSFDRLRDTLLHEMCHAAVWLVNKSRCNHGPLWKTWAARCKLILPAIDLPDRCHAYAIFYPFTYKCTSCSWQCSRHSKSSKLKSDPCPSCGKSVYLIYNKKS